MGLVEEGRRTRPRACRIRAPRQLDTRELTNGVIARAVHLIENESYHGRYLPGEPWAPGYPRP